MSVPTPPPLTSPRPCMKQKVRRGPVVLSSPSGSGGNMSLDLRMAAGTLWGVRQVVVGMCGERREAAAQLEAGACPVARLRLDALPPNAQAGGRLAEPACCSIHAQGYAPVAHQSASLT